MSVYRRRTRVAAPLAEVWDFHSKITGLEALTPDWLNLRVEAIDWPEGHDGADGTLVAGTAVHLSMQPFGVAPRQRWTSRITDREVGDGQAYFRDVMEDGPFPHWVHTHQFFADGDATVIQDTVEYELPGGALGRAAGPAAVVGFAPMFRRRHSETKRLLEA